MNVIGSDSVFTYRMYRIYTSTTQCNVESARVQCTKEPQDASRDATNSNTVLKYSLRSNYDTDRCCVCVCSSLYSYVYRNSSVLTLQRDAVACTMSASHKCGILHFIASRKLTVLSLLCSHLLLNVSTFKHRANTDRAGSQSVCIWYAGMRMRNVLLVLYAIYISQRTLVSLECIKAISSARARASVSRENPPLSAHTQHSAQRAFTVLQCTRSRDGKSVFVWRTQNICLCLCVCGVTLGKAAM